MTKEKIPDFRFSGYTDAWEERKLGEVAEVTMGQSPSSTNYTANPSDYILVQGNADLKNGYVFPRVWTTQITKTADAGDLIISVRAPVGDVAKTAFDVVLGRGVAGIKGNEFLFQTLSKLKKDGYWKRLSTGSTFESINSEDIKSTIIQIPSLPEQESIGNFFRQLDDLLTLHERKLDLLKEHKKTYLRLLFPAKGQKVPALRFDSFEGDWEEKKVGEIFKVTRGQVLSATKVSKIKDNKNQYPVYSSQTQNNGLLGYYSECLFSDAITWTTDGANAGTVNFRKGKFYSTNVNGVLLSESGYANKMVAEILNSVAWKFVSKVGNPKLMNNVMSEITLSLPSLPEQEAIGNFFSTLDEEITQVESKLASLNAMKATLLRKIFV
ncbi:restriction endonuclease subunit S [Streptococcus dysgalactiae]|uniref:restriction endonuclease subunit S n=5 Tax=Streptococcus dysgalactiae TaxID=1334 RepID=UPI0001F863FE|nr:restriction endonuclease subunit S [Streptococcus dysgalactiae]EFY01974.1 Type I restriction-modification system specificity subunit [Streptococcus dysgalactiae subsp. dysgalactiae ATCC 27957]MCB2846440.1 restriction endonuclease subunit S [Streptococcus dysgalactiae subsp. dysgalactiae]QQT03088.1 restriction endonuclease subunit S [Streptococcus dysgalactiae]SUN44264.1 Type I restriction-modification system specificity subunit [Streptococcus dysgalactiae subsp. dysgalactiae]SUN48606.1 Type